MRLLAPRQGIWTMLGIGAHNDDLVLTLGLHAKPRSGRGLRGIAARRFDENFLPSPYADKLRHGASRRHDS